MAQKDYYVILGIPRNESAGGIRAAYRDLVKRHHPDVAGPSGTGRFRDIVEAYEVLSDPARRRDHNDELARWERGPSGLVVGPVAEAVGCAPGSIFDRAANVQPSLGELFECYIRNFTGSSSPKADQEEGLNIEVVLTAEEAVRGGVLPITVPVYEPCPSCQGTGVDWPFRCLTCGGTGLVEERETVRVRIPPRSRPGTVIELPLRGLGIHNLYLRIHLLVG